MPNRQGWLPLTATEVNKAEQAVLCYKRGEITRPELRRMLLIDFGVNGDHIDMVLSEIDVMSLQELEQEFRD